MAGRGSPRPPAGCNPGIPCAAHPTGIGRVDFFDRGLAERFSVSHGILGTNSETVQFRVCAAGFLWEDSNGNGQLEEPSIQPQDCRTGSVRVRLL